MNNNSYSKYRYSNSLDIKFRSDGSVFGTDLKGSVRGQGICKQLDDDVIASSPWGATWVTNYLYKATRITNVDTTIVPSSYKGPTFFKLFKL